MIKLTNLWEVNGQCMIQPIDHKLFMVKLLNQDVVSDRLIRQQ